MPLQAKRNFMQRRYLDLSEALFKRSYYFWATICMKGANKLHQDSEIFRLAVYASSSDHQNWTKRISSSRKNCPTPLARIPEVSTVLCFQHLKHSKAPWVTARILFSFRQDQLFGALRLKRAMLG